MKCQLNNIQIGKNVRFYGTTFITRYPQSAITIGDDCEFNSSCHFNYRGINHNCILQTSNKSAKITIGSRCGFSGVSIVCDKEVTFGNNVIVGTNTIIGDRDDHTDRYPTEPMPVIIDDNVWIGMNCVVLKGVKIGKNTIIGAGSVVTHDIPANCVAAGVPCRVIKTLQI